jgi:MoxR-like ATPase
VPGTGDALGDAMSTDRDATRAERALGPREVAEAFRGQAYLADRGLATAVSLALRLGRPLLLEGDAGVGKTEVAKVLSAILDVPLIRLQCHEGIDASQALYDWDYPRQLLALRAMEAMSTRGNGEVAQPSPGSPTGGAPTPAGLDEVADQLYTERFLVERPLLRALRSDGEAVLLIDEIDRADDEFEAFLLEVLSDFQVSIPELGTIAAARPPVVILTSNRTRDLHEALRRRALYHWIDHPDAATEAEIIRVRAPEVPAGLARTVADVVVRLRQLELFKPPGVAETLDWARALTLLDVSTLDREVLEDTLSTLVKDHDDLQRVTVELDRIFG